VERTTSGCPPSPVRLDDTHLSVRWRDRLTSAGAVTVGDTDPIPELTRRIVTLCDTADLDLDAANRLGADLAGSGLPVPAALAGTVEFIGRELAERIGPTPCAERLVALQVAVTRGYAERLAYVDQLTGLPNRARLLARMDELATDFGKNRVALFCLDLDRFMLINDSLGHQDGDQLLRVVATRLRETFPDADLVARTGGDEFAVLFTDTDGDEQIAGWATGMLLEIRKPLMIGGRELAISASAGVVERPVPRLDTRELMRDADMALHWAKEEGRGRWAAYDADRKAKDIARYALSAIMLSALGRGEFYLDYQPLVRLSDQAVVGAEALVRWRHPERGMIPPDEFIGLAEDGGMIVELGRWVLDRACAQAADWQRRYSAAAPFVSVNLSARQLLDPGLVGDVQNALGTSGLVAGRLQLELTESMVLSTSDHALETMRTLSRMGVRIAIDDFGTGYSNLAYLRDLPVHELKIAGSFIAGLRRGVPDGERPDVDQNIVATLVNLAHNLKLTVTAEGVETLAEVAHLADIGCDLGQGWFFARPGPPETLDRLLSTTTT
jgi:diguanylate cyclase (GGDEF)-like protein